MEDHLIHPGACHNTGDNFIAKCALQPSDCLAAPNSVYRPPMWVQENFYSAYQECRNEKLTSLTLGRCDNDVEGYLCTSDSSACYSPSSFVPQDPTCTLLYDHRPVQGSYYARSFYGQCTRKTIERDIDAAICAWSESDCPTGMEWKVAHETQDLCTCERVRTGACITDNEFSFCAVSPNVCSFAGPEYEFVAMEDLKPSYNVSCWLCPEDEVPEVPQLDTVQAGACVGMGQGYVFSHCAVTKSQCQTEQYFASPRELVIGLDALEQEELKAERNGDDSYTTPPQDQWFKDAEKCLSPAAVQEIHLGRCNSDDSQYVCTSTTCAKEDPDTEPILDPSCTMIYNEGEGPLPFTQFGHCRHRWHPFNTDNSTSNGQVQYDQEASFCVWSPDDCDEDAEFMYESPLAGMWHHNLPPCQCDHVRTGACLGDDLGYCAVDATSCDEGYSFYTASQLVMRSSSMTADFGVMCYLCEPGIPQAPVPSYVGGDRFEPRSKRPTWEDRLSASGDTGKAIVALIVILLTGCVFMTCLCCLVKKKVMDEPVVVTTPVSESPLSDPAPPPADHEGTAATTTTPGEDDQDHRVII